jgi:hypothetical protein
MTIPVVIATRRSAFRRATRALASTWHRALLRNDERQLRALQRLSAADPEVVGAICLSIEERRHRLARVELI